MKSIGFMRWLGPRPLITLLIAVPISACAGPIEDKFRSFLDGLKKSGQGAVAAANSAVNAAGLAPEAKTSSLSPRKDTLPLGQDQYVLFVTSGCVSCNGLAEKLKGMGLGTVEVLNLSASATAREAFAATGAIAVPAILIGKRIVVGADNRLIERALIETSQENAQQQQGQGA